MSRTIIVGENLIGDLLLHTPAIRAYARAYPETEIHYWSPGEKKDGHLGTQVLLEGNPYLAGIHTGPEELLPPSIAIYYPDCMQAFIWASQRGKQLSQGFGPQFGVEVGDDDASLRYDYRVSAEENCAAAELAVRLGGGQPIVIIARHSHSCTSNDPRIRQPNKCYPNAIWVDVAKWLIKQGYTPVAVGASREEKDVRYHEWPIPGKRLYGQPIRQIAALLPHAAAVISVDTGIRHLAACTGANLCTFSGVIPLSLIKCVPHYDGQRVYEEVCPIPHASAQHFIKKIQQVLG